MQGDWYMIMTRRSAEDIACDWLQNVMAATTFYPVATTYHANGAKTPRAAFPGYVFAKWESTPDWERMRMCSAIFKLMQYLAEFEEFEPVKFKDQVILDLMQRQLKGEFDNDTRKNPVYKQFIDKTVKIPRGPFMGHSGKVRYIEDQNVILVIRMLGKSVRMMFPFEEIFGVNNYV